MLSLSCSSLDDGLDALSFSDIWEDFFDIDAVAFVNWVVVGVVRFNAAVLVLQVELHNEGSLVFNADLACIVTYGRRKRRWDEGWSGTDANEAIVELDNQVRNIEVAHNSLWYMECSNFLGDNWGGNGKTNVHCKPKLQDANLSKCA